MKNNKKEYIKYGIKTIEEFNTNNQLIKKTIFRIDNKTINYIDEYDKNNGNLLKSTFYFDDGKTISIIEEYQKQNFTVDTCDDDDNLIKKTWYHSDGTFKNAEYYDVNEEFVFDSDDQIDEDNFNEDDDNE